MIQTVRTFWIIIGLIILIPVVVYGVVILLCYLRCKYAGIDSVKVKRCKERFLKENENEEDEESEQGI